MSVRFRPSAYSPFFNVVNILSLSKFSFSNIPIYLRNKSYVRGGLDVVGHLRRQMPDKWKATLCAVDGNVVENVQTQILGLPDDATHLFISAGGNNALLNADVLKMRVSSSAEVFDKLADLASAFEAHYRAMLQAILRLNKPPAVCTIYYPRMPEYFAQKIAVAALATFNDVIIKQAFLAGVPLIDLRLVCAKIPITPTRLSRLRQAEARLPKPFCASHKNTIVRRVELKHFFSEMLNKSKDAMLTAIPFK